MLVLILLASMALSFLITYGVREYALRHEVIDVPNARSSHTVPTPRGGGVSIVFVFVFALLVFYFLDVLSHRYLIAYIGGGGMVALIGFLDDHGGVSPLVRLGWHLSSALWVLLWIGGLPVVPMFGDVFEFGAVGNVLALLFLVWLLNLYNFMDGINGIAGLEAVTVCVGASIIWFIHGETTLLSISMLMASAALGFLFWNFPKARIFMGDAGSGFIGFVIGVLALHALGVFPSSFWSLQILLGVFVVDATFTLVRRMARGEKVHEAHRSHAYQYAARILGSHTPVTLGVVLINSLWLFPIALLVSFDFLDGTWGVLIAYSPLVLLCFYLGAGEREIAKQ